MRIFLSKEKDIKKLVVTRENRAHSNARATEYAVVLLGLYLFPLKLLKERNNSGERPLDYLIDSEDE